jgi:hypothetical protein
LPVSRVSAGQIIARPVTNKDGAVLCPRGFVLTGAAILRLQNAGVDMLFVDSPGETGPSATKRLEALEERFSGVDDPVLLKLKQVIREYLSDMATADGETPV